MSINDYKLAFAQRSLQIVLFNQQGVPVESCNTFINLTEYHEKQHSLFEVFPFLDSLKKHLLSLPLDGSEIHFPRVEFSHNQTDWFLDNTFYRSVSQPELIVWVLSRFEDDRRYLREIQQERNELVVQKSSLPNRTQILQQAAQMELLRQTQLLEHNYQENCQKPLQNTLNKLQTIAQNLHEYVGNMYLRELNQWVQLSQQQLNTNNPFFAQWQPQSTTNQTFVASNALQMAITAFKVYNPNVHVFLETNSTLPNNLIGNVHLLSQLFFVLLHEADHSNNKIKIHLEEENRTAEDTQLCILLPIEQVNMPYIHIKKLTEQLNGTLSSHIAPNNTPQLSIKLPFALENQN
ncbi:MAG: hypothetical protein IPN94_24385 [Sphingobacteriales bacterium]|nr:hypothetical protein [Sphingobacteriales bacterium]